MGSNALHTWPALRLFQGQTVHARRVPFEQRFSYKLFMIDVDIDRLDDASAMCTTFSIDRSALYTLRTRDHGARETGSLRPWADAKFQNAGIDLKGGTIRLLALPRHLFYKFAPISLWIGYDPDGAPRGIIYEVNNTFGDSHSYVSALPGSNSKHDVAKAMYVSPFFDVSGDYRFSLRLSDDKLQLVIDNHEDGRSTHMAALTGVFAPATSGGFLKAAFTRPLSSIGVSWGIHWEALKLFIRGAGYRSRPAAPDHSYSIAQPASQARQQDAST